MMSDRLRLSSSCEGSLLSLARDLETRRLFTPRAQVAEHASKRFRIDRAWNDASALLVRDGGLWLSTARGVLLGREKRALSAGLRVPFAYTLSSSWILPSTRTALTCALGE